MNSKFVKLNKDTRSYHRYEFVHPKNLVAKMATLCLFLAEL